MSLYNYYQTVQKSTNVTHACVCSFSDSKDLHLILGKSNHLEICQYSNNCFKTISDLPIFGRIATLEPFRPQDETHDLLFIATQEFKFCVLEWNSVTSKLVIRKKGDISKAELNVGRRIDNTQLCAIDPDRAIVVIHLYDGLFQILRFDGLDHNTYPFDTRRIKVHKVLDIKFLFGCSKPTIAVLFQDINDDRHFKTYTLSLDGISFVEGSLFRVNLHYTAHLLIPVPSPPYGILIIGEENIVYCSADHLKTISFEHSSITKAYGRYPRMLKYLLGDHTGALRSLAITYDKKKVGLKMSNIGDGETSIPSTISFLNDETVYIGSSYGDSQLIKLNQETVEILESHANLGPILDFCMLGLERQGLGEIVTCSGAYKDGSLRVLCYALRPEVKLGCDLMGIIGMKRIWSLKSSIDDSFDTFLVMTDAYATHVFKADADGFVVAGIAGFCSGEESLFCHDAIHNQAVQVTSRSVRLVSTTTKKLKWECFAPQDCSYTVATANAAQILMSTNIPSLVYMEIEDGELSKKKETQLDSTVSCLRLNSIGGNPNNHSNRAAVGFWRNGKDNPHVAIYSLPNLEKREKVELSSEPESTPRSVLFWDFGPEISYLLCGLANGHLVYFRLVASDSLTERKTVYLGTETPIRGLQSFSFKNTSCVLAVSEDRPILISRNGEDFVFSYINMKKLSCVCPVNFSAYEDMLAFGKPNNVTIGTIDHTHTYDLHIQRFTPLKEQPLKICYQEMSLTFGIITSKLCNRLESHFVKILESRTFKVKLTFPLQEWEHGRSIISCSLPTFFDKEEKVYYCVGTAFVFCNENESSKGRILFFASRGGGEFQLVSETETKGAVNSLNQFMDGHLLATVGGSIQLYKWVFLKDSLTFELQTECGNDTVILPLCVQPRGDDIFVGDVMDSISLFSYKVSEGKAPNITKDKICVKKNGKPITQWISTFELLKENSYREFKHQLILGSTADFKLVTIQDIERVSTLNVRSEYYTGEFISKFQHGYVAPPMVSSDAANVPPIITFGTFNGMIGVIAPLPCKKFDTLKLVEEEVIMATDNNAVGLSYKEWRQYNHQTATTQSRHFLDGDIMKLFLGLEESKMIEIAHHVEQTLSGWGYHEAIDVNSLYEEVVKLTTMLH